MFKKIRKYWLLQSRLAMFHIKNPRGGDFWAWLFKRVYDPGSIDFGNETFICFLLYAGLRLDEHFRVRKIYHDFQELVDGTVSQEYKEKILASIMAAEVRESQSHHVTMEN